MSEKTTLFIFFVRASGGPQVTSISSPESWIDKARQATRSPDAEVVLIKQGEWDAPDLNSYEDSYLRNKFPLIVKGIQTALTARGVPPIVPEKLLEDMEVMGDDLTRLLVCVVKYTGEIALVSKSTEITSASKSLMMKECSSCRSQVEALRRVCPRCGGDSFVYINAQEMGYAGRQAEEAAQHVDRGSQFFKQGRYAEAENEFRKAIETNPYNDVAHNNMGILFLNQGRPDDAILWLEKAMALNPHDKEILADLNLAREKAKTGQKEKATSKKSWQFWKK